MAIKIKGTEVINDNRNAEFYNQVKINGGDDPRLIIGPEDGDYSDYYYSIRHANNRLEFGSHNSATNTNNYNQVSMTESGVLQARAGMFIQGSGNVLTVTGDTFIVGDTVQDGDIGLAHPHKLTGKINNLEVVDGAYVHRGPNYPIFKRMLTGADVHVTTASSWANITGWNTSWGGFTQGNWGYSASDGSIIAPVSGIYEFSLQLAFRGLDEGSAGWGLKFKHDDASGAHVDQFLATWDTNEMYVIGSEHALDAGAGLASEGHQFTLRSFVKLTAGHKLKAQYFADNLGDGSGNVHIDVENSSYDQVGNYVGPMCWWEGRLITATD